MLESSLGQGRQENTGGLETMQYGVSITDACIGWETTEHLILWAQEQLHRHLDLAPAAGVATADAR